jgi:predicted GIY-YIG superfamily endonuclease
MDAGGVYLLATADGAATYIGQTVNFARRLRQHRGEISGGARATRGRHMEPVAVVRGPLTLTQRLWLERRWKMTRCAGPTAVARRLRSLDRVLAMDRWFRRQPDGDVAALRPLLRVERFADAPISPRRCPPPQTRSRPRS